MVPFTHCVVVMTTPVGTSSLQNLCNNLHAISFVAILVVVSFILLIIIPHKPLYIPYVFFISTTKYFSLVLSLKYYVGLSPIDGRPVMKEMSSMSMEMGSFNHKNSPWRTSIYYLKKLFTSFPPAKVGNL
jgi:hypothetical protein